MTRFGGDAVDASLLLMPMVGFVGPRDPRFLGTLAAIEKDLVSGPYVYRYRAPDDFGEPENAFIVCSFWDIDARARVGRLDEARRLFEHMLTHSSSLV